MTAATLDAMGEQKFVSLTTFRRSGVGVSTAVWIGRDGDALVVSTPAGTGKVKRLRHTARVELRPCSRTGRVADGAPAVTGVAELVVDPAAVERLTAPLREKYGLEFAMMSRVEKLVRRGHAERFIVRITADPAG